jgi:class I fructose-bisphosphate aldolase
MTGEQLGDAVVVAIDHGLHWGALEGFEDPVRTLDRVLEADPDGVLASISFLRRFEERIADANVYTIGTLDVIYDSTLPGGDEEAEIHTQAFNIGAAAEVADALKIALVYGRDDPDVLEANVEFVAQAAETCRQNKVPLVVEPTLWGNRVTDEFDPSLLEHANRLAFELGADILKSPYPPEGFDRIVGNAPQPMYIAGGPPAETDREVLEMVYDACDDGALGVMFGRNIWQRDDPVSVIHSLKTIVHDGASVNEAATHL